jgi:putative ABC transport system ATP-binding protein
LLLADEPTAALDPFQGVEVVDLLVTLVNDLDSSAVIVSHDWDLVRAKGLDEVSPKIARHANGSTSTFCH